MRSENLTNTPESLKELANRIAFEVYSFSEGSPEIIDIYSSREGDEGVITLWQGFLEEALDKEPFSVKNRKTPKVRILCEPASRFYSVDLGALLDLGVMPMKYSENPLGKEEYYPQLSLIDRKLLGHIQDGIVIDHIPFGRVFRLVSILGMDNPVFSGRISLGEGYSSRKIDKKGILKVEGVNLFPKQITDIAFYAEGSTINIIKFGRINQKIQTKIPNFMEGIVKCPDLNCLSNEELDHLSWISHRGFEEYKCERCETQFGLDKFQLEGLLNFEYY